MSHDLSIEPLRRDLIAQALPLVRSLKPDMSLEEWESYVDVLAESVDAAADGAEPSAGVIVAMDPEGYLHGLFTYAALEDMIHGRVLAVDNVIAVDLLGRDRATRLMIGEMNRLAEALACQAVHVNLNEDRSAFPRGCSSVFSRFREAGHTIDGVRLCLEIEERPRRAVGAEE